MELTGLIDLHIHGAFGIDVLTARDADLDRLALGLEERGVEGFVPTLVPVPLADLAPLLSSLSAWVRSRRPGDGRGAMPLGIHLEGPFVSPNRSGALHRECLLDGSDARRVDAFFEAVGDLPGRPMVTLAPEVPGGLDLVSAFVKRGFLVSLGHTEADVPTLDEALKRGARHMTHFGNAMKPLHHRDAGAGRLGAPPRRGDGRRHRRPPPPLPRDARPREALQGARRLRPHQRRGALRRPARRGLPRLGRDAHGVEGRRPQRLGRPRGERRAPSRLRRAAGRAAASRRWRRRATRPRRRRDGCWPPADQTFQYHPRFSQYRRTAQQTARIASACRCEAR